MHLRFSGKQFPRALHDLHGIREGNPLAPPCEGMLKRLRRTQVVLRGFGVKVIWIEPGKFNTVLRSYGFSPNTVPWQRPPLFG